jgi:hypothetical protein
MKRIRFNKYNDWKNKTLMFVAVICFFLGIVGFLGENKAQWYKILQMIGYVAMIIFFARMFYGKYYVGWNKIGITIRLNSFFSNKSFNFKDVTSTVFENEFLTITKKNGKEIKLDLNGLEETDTRRLFEIIIQNTVTNNL